MLYRLPLLIVFLKSSYSVSFQNCFPHLTSSVPSSSSSSSSLFSSTMSCFSSFCHNSGIFYSYKQHILPPVFLIYPHSQSLILPFSPPTQSRLHLIAVLYPISLPPLSSKASSSSFLSWPCAKTNVHQSFKRFFGCHSRMLAEAFSRPLSGRMSSTWAVKWIRRVTCLSIAFR